MTILSRIPVKEEPFSDSSELQFMRYFEANWTRTFREFQFKWGKIAQKDALKFLNKTEFQQISTYAIRKGGNSFRPFQKIDEENTSELQFMMEWEARSCQEISLR